MAEPVFSNIFTSHGTILIVSTLLTWALFWGAFTVAVCGTWRRPSLLWFGAGVLGPVGPLLGLTVGLSRKRKKGSTRG